MIVETSVSRNRTKIYRSGIPYKNLNQISHLQHLEYFLQEFILGELEGLELLDRVHQCPLLTDVDGSNAG